MPQGVLSTDLVTFTILIDGTRLPETLEVYSIDIWKEVNRIPRAEIVVLDGDVSNETFSASDGDWFIPGKKVEIQAGYHSEESTVFQGIVTTQAIKLRNSGNSILTVSCSDPAVKMTTVPRSRYYYDAKETDVFEQIIRRYSGLKSDIDDTGYQFHELLQYQSTDWDFMLSRADVNGLFCTVNNGKISLKKPEFSRDPAEIITYGNNLLEIDAEMEATSQLSGVQGVTWDFSKTETSQVDAQSSSPVSPGNLSSSEMASTFEHNDWKLENSAKLPDEVLQAWTNAKRLKHELAKIRGRARLQGISTIIPGDIVKLEGLGGRFNGKAYVSGTKHSIHNGNWVTDVQFGLSPEWFSEQYKVSSLPASGMLPSVSGLQIGLVTQIEGDPDGDERIKVRLPSIDAQEEGLWARLATAGSGNNRGVIIRPEIGDEVIVGFIHDDPNQPVILGTVNSSNNPAPIEADDDNPKKGWRTKSGIKWIVDDDKPAVLIEMPSGKKVNIDDDAGQISLEDENGNKMKMESNGISLNSNGDIEIKAGGSIKVEAGTSLNAKAQTSFKAQGSASSEISSTGTTTVKGSIVKIN